MPKSLLKCDASFLNSLLNNHNFIVSYLIEIEGENLEFYWVH